MADAESSLRVYHNAEVRTEFSLDRFDAVDLAQVLLGRRSAIDGLPNHATAIKNSTSAYSQQHKIVAGIPAARP